MIKNVFNFLKPRNDRENNLGDLVADMHAHLLPGIDDGAPDLETSLALIEGLIGLGYRKLFATPHIMHERYPNQHDVILRKRDEVRQVIQQRQLELDTFDAAAEYFLDEHFTALMQKQPLLTLPGGYVLIEMAIYQEFPALHQTIFDLQMKGYKPILAHPERYLYYRHLDDYARLKELGLSLQVNLLSLAGYYHPSVKKDAWLMVQNGLVDFLGTDLHHPGQLQTLTKAADDASFSTAIKGIIKNSQL